MSNFNEEGREVGQGGERERGGREVFWFDGRKYRGG